MTKCKNNAVQYEVILRIMKYFVPKYKVSRMRGFSFGLLFERFRAAEGCLPYRFTNPDRDLVHLMQSINYSVLKASTGSFFAAEREGMIPAIRVRITLIATSNTATPMGRVALRFTMPVRASRIALMGMQSR